MSHVERREEEPAGGGPEARAWAPVAVLAPPPDGRPSPPPAAVEPEGDVRVKDLLSMPQMWGFVATTACVEFCRGALFIALLPAYLTQGLHLSVAGLGMVISGQYLSDTAFKIPAGWLVDRFGPWRVLLPFLSLAALAVYLMPHVHHVAPFVVLGILFGLGTSANWPAVLSGSVQLGGMRSRASATSITFLAWLAAGGIGPVLISFLVGRGFGTAFLVLAVVGTGAPVAAALGLFGVLRRRNDPPWRTPAAVPIGETLAALRGNLRQAGWLIPGMFIQMLALGIVLPVMVPFARGQLHLTQPQYGVMLLAGGGVTVLCLLPLGRIVDRWGSKGFLVAGFALSGIAVALIATGSGEGDLLWRVSLLGLSYAFILPAWNGLTVGKIDADRRGLLLGVFMAIEGLGEAIGPAVGGALYVRDYRLPFLATAGILVAVAVFYLVVPARNFRPDGGGSR